MTGKTGDRQQVVPTTTATQARIRLYQPTKKPVTRAGEWIATPWGRCRVVGRLGQRHADLVDALAYCSEKRRDLADIGSIEVLVDMARVRKVISSTYSHEQLWKLIQECMTALVEIEVPGVDYPALGHLIDSVEPSAMTRRDPLGGERHLWRVRFGRAMSKFIESDPIKMYHDPAPIARLRHGISQAVARHILTHKSTPNGGWHVDTALRAVLGDQEKDGSTSMSMRDGRRRLKEDAEALKAAGILLADDRIHKGSVAQPPDSVAQPPDFSAFR